MIDELIEIRKKLHKNPEPSGQEYETQKTILEYLEKNTSAEITKIAKTGVIADFNPGNSAQSVMIRVDTDALPIIETNDFEHKSQNENISHKCGHDGHTAIGLGLAKKLEDSNPGGRVMVLFQPSEENGYGAKSVIEDEDFSKFKPDIAFALHNLPGFKKHQIVYRYDNFTSSVQSMIVKLKGKTSHAAEPENGRNPSMAISKLLRFANKLTLNDTSSDNFSLVTPIHTLIGEKAYGTTPGYGEQHFTIRAWTEKKMNSIIEKMEDRVKELSEKYELENEISYTDIFESNRNDETAVNTIINSANELKFDIKEIEHPFKWGEDFGVFTQRFSGAMFGLGAGEDTPALHNPDYDFPDELIEPGVNMFYNICKNYLKG